jgi:predicted nucleic acid-binding protein
MSWLLDTAVVSEPVRPKPDRAVLRWFEAHREVDMYLSVLTLGELQKGLTRMPQSKRRDHLTAWIEEDLGSRFEGRVLTVSAEISRIWGLITGNAENNGRPLPAIDALIAATAIHHKLTVVTRNTRDFLATGVAVEDPWRAGVS